MWGAATFAAAATLTATNAAPTAAIPVGATTVEATAPANATPTVPAEAIPAETHATQTASAAPATIDALATSTEAPFDQLPPVTPYATCDAHMERRVDPHYQRARQLYHSGQYQEAIASLVKAELVCPGHAASWMLRGVVYEDMHHLDSAVWSYRTALAIDPDVFPNVYYTLGNLEYSIGLYADAESHLATFISRLDAAKNAKAANQATDRTKPAPSEKLRQKADDVRHRNAMALELSRHQVPFAPRALSDSINTPAEEYLPLVSLDDQYLIFTRRYTRNEPLPHLEEDFFISERDSLGEWKMAQRMPEPVNSDGNEGAQSISADGRYLYFAGCNRDEGRGSCDIYVCVRNGDKWGKPINLGYPVNTEAWESQPSISSDGRTLYFCSNRAGGMGGADIWKTVRNDQGVWGEPINLGPNINSPGNESSPFIHPDQETLYFSSNGRDGLGGMDLYLSRKDKNGHWGKAVNLGYPINTYADESTLSVDRTGRTAYFSSSKLGGRGGLDIYSFELYEAARPQLVSFMNGVVRDAHDHTPLQAHFELVDLSTAQTTVESFSDAVNGSFLVCLPAGKTYALNVSKDGYLFHSEHFALEDAHALTPLYKEIALSRVHKGESMVLRNIFFATDHYALDTTSFAELNRLLRFLKEQPQWRIEISGHTDNTGRETYNVQLSEQRAKSVAQYLIERGIDPGRIETVGYGSSKPVATNETAEGRSQNRRTEIKML